MSRPRGFVARLAAAAGAILVAGVTSGCATTPTVQPLTVDQRQLNLESFDSVWTTIRDRHWDPRLGGLDWPAVRDELRPKMERAATMDQARGVLDEMIDRLGQSHFLIIPAEASQDASRADEEVAQDGMPGLDLRIVEGKALVTVVWPDSPAYRAGVRTGWEVVRVGDDDINEILTRLQAKLPEAPNKPMHMTYAVLGRLDGPVGEPVRVAFRDGAGRVEERVLERIEPRGRVSNLGSAGAVRAWIETKKVGGNIGYIAIDSFVNPSYVMQTFNEAIESFRHADGVIIDLRGNPGGIGAMAMGMAGWFVESDQTLGRIVVRDNELKAIATARATPYTGPLAVLVDGLSGSASEFLAGGLQEIGRAHVVGTRTKGEVLAANFERLPNGDLFLFAVADFVTAGGRRLEGVGVIPDIEVSPTREALLAGRDLILESAIDWVRKQHSGSSAATRVRAIDLKHAFHGEISMRRVLMKVPLSLGLTTVLPARVLVAALAVLAVADATLAGAEEEKLPKAEQILDRYVEVTGGKEAYAKIKNRVTKGTIEIAGQEIKLTTTIYVASPNKSYTLSECEELGKIEKGCDGEVAWERSTMTGPVIKTGDERALMIRAGRLDASVNWRDLYQKAECVGLETVDDQPCYKIVLTPPEGEPETRYYDKSTGLLAKSALTLKVPAGTVPIEAYTSDYKKVDGILLPHKARQVVAGVPRTTFNVERFQHNVDIPKDRFDLPADVQALVEKQKKSADSAPAKKP